MKLIVALTGASGIIYGIRFLEFLKSRNVEVILLVSETAKIIAKHEAREFNLEDLAVSIYDQKDLSAPISSGSYYVDAMVIVPASMKTIAALATGYCENLITRAADVQLKENRKLILVPRETPLHEIHLSNLLKLAQIGAIILPAMPAFYHNPKSVSDMTNFIVGKILDQLEFSHNLYKRWS